MRRLGYAFVGVFIIGFSAFLLSGPGSLPAAEEKGGDQAGKLPWTNDLEKARKRAKEHEKLILADFTGSDWCVWCKKLKEEVFHTKEFRQWAEERFVFLKVDFPRSKEQPEWVKKQNKKLAQRFNVKGFPTILFFDHEWRERARAGYRPGGPTQWIERVEKQLDRGGDDGDG